MKPKIFVFSNVSDGGGGPCYAMAEDGTVLASKFCINEKYALEEFSYNAVYEKHYPNGYELEYVPVKDLSQHVELNQAIGRNRVQGAVARRLRPRKEIN